MSDIHMSKKYKIILITSIIISFLGGFIVSKNIERFLGDSHRQPAAPSELTDEQIREFLEKEIGFTSSGGKLFCAFEKLGSEEIAQLHYTYIWAGCSEYTSATEESSGIRTPVALISHYDINTKREEIVALNEPGDGSTNAEDIKKIFPEPEKVIGYDYTKTNKEIIEAAKNYYK